VSRDLHRSAVTGRIVTAAFAAENPDTTTTEQVEDSQHSKEIFDAVDAHLDAAKALLAEIPR
jgi:hypothetical protein